MKSSKSPKVLPAFLTALLQRLPAISNTAALIEAVAELAEEGVSTNAMAAARNCHSYEIRHLLRLHRRLTPKSLQMLGREQITAGHARALATWSGEMQDQILGQCLAYGWSVRELERRRSKAGDNASKRELAGHYARLADTVAEQSGYPCEFKIDPANPKGGKLALVFSSFDELDGILRRLQIRLEDDDG